MTLERPNNRPRTRASEPTPPPDVSAVPPVGRFCAIRADPRDYEDGFCIAKVKEHQGSHFQGIYLVKASEQGDIFKVQFVESENVDRFDIDTVVSEVISAVQFNNSNTVQVDKEKIEEIIIICSNVGRSVF